MELKHVHTCASVQESEEGCFPGWGDRETALTRLKKSEAEWKINGMQVI